ncbi:MAG: lytic transglycosylase domain-containing protein [Micropepsaceae bacterium]
MKTPSKTASLKNWWLLSTALTIGALTAAPALTQTMSPIFDDEGSRHVRSHTQYLSASDLALLGSAFDAADRKQWDSARQIASQISNPSARDLVLWRAFVTKDNGAPFADINRFLGTHRDWPNQRGLQARAEEAMPAETMQPGEVIDWFQGRDPVSGEGMLKLGDAYLRKGQDSNARNWIRKGWVEGNFTLDRIALISSRYGSLLSADDHRRRASRLVWANEYGQANAMSNWLPNDFEAMISARIKLRQAARDADAAYNRVPSDLQRDSGLLFDRARWLRKRDREVEARPLLILASSNLDGAAPTSDEWWAERNYQTREALDAGNTQQAYQIASTHAMRKDSGVNYAEAEFLAGWIALRYLNKPDTAIDHFTRLREGVTAPISVARAHYWSGRAAEKAGRSSEASRQYNAAAQFPGTFYGQLAAATVNPRATLDLPGAKGTSASRQAFMDQSVVQAMQSLADVGSEGLLRTFALAAAENFTDRDQFVYLTNFLRQLNQPALSLRVAKRGIQKNIPVYDIAYPTLPLPVYRGDGTPPDSALVLGLTRQESEFDPEAFSSAGARGLMQMMPATASLTARRHGIPFGGKSDLFTPSVNLQLGMAHVSDLLGDFAGSFVLSITSYNAGGGRINQWISTYGDPRNANADVVDWIERIPFSETRNYVQRVMENTQVYRNILAGRDVQMAILSDMKRGAHTEIASNDAQFSSSPGSATAVPVAAAPTSQFANVVSSSPVYDDEEEPKLKPKKSSSKKVSKKKRKAVAANSKRCKSGSRGCRRRG